MREKRPTSRTAIKYAHRRRLRSWAIVVRSIFGAECWTHDIKYSYTQWSRAKRPLHTYPISTFHSISDCHSSYFFTPVFARTIRIYLRRSHARALCVYVNKNYERLWKHVKIVNYVLIISLLYLFIYFNFYWYVCTLNDVCYEDTRHPFNSISFHFQLALCVFFFLLLLLFSFSVKNSLRRFSFFSDVVVVVVDFSQFYLGSFRLSLFSVCAYSQSLQLPFELVIARSCKNLTFIFHTWSCTSCRFFPPIYPPWHCV